MMLAFVDVVKNGLSLHGDGNVDTTLDKRRNVVVGGLNGWIDGRKGTALNERNSVAVGISPFLPFFVEPMLKQHESVC
jgi:hypothetical protein